MTSDRGRAPPGHFSFRLERAARLGDDARFFASRETFSLVHLCNHWTAQVLAAGGVGVRPVRSVLSAEVMDAARAAALDTGGRGD